MADDVRDLLLRLAPTAVCDGCLADQLGLPGRQYANQQARRLTAAGFARRRDICGLCYGERVVTRAI